MNSAISCSCHIISCLVISCHHVYSHLFVLPLCEVLPVHCLTKRSFIVPLLILVMTFAFALLTHVFGLLFWICLPVDCFACVLTQACDLTTSCEYCLDFMLRSYNKDPLMESTQPKSSLQLACRHTLWRFLWLMLIFLSLALFHVFSGFQAFQASQD